MAGGQYIHWDMQLLTPKHGTRDDCLWVMEKIRTMCHIAEPDHNPALMALKGDWYTQGGWFKFDDDQSYFGMDPMWKKPDGTQGDENECC